MSNNDKECVAPKNRGTGVFIPAHRLHLARSVFLATYYEGKFFLPHQSIPQFKSNGLYEFNFEEIAEKIEA